MGKFFNFGKLASVLGIKYPYGIKLGRTRRFYRVRSIFHNDGTTFLRAQAGEGCFVNDRA